MWALRLGSLPLQASGQLQDSDSFISPKVSSEPPPSGGTGNSAFGSVDSQELPMIVNRDWEIDMAALQARIWLPAHTLWAAAAWLLQLRLPAVPRVCVAHGWIGGFLSETTDRLHAISVARNTPGLAAYAPCPRLLCLRVHCSCYQGKDCSAALTGTCLPPA